MTDNLYHETSYTYLHVYYCNLIFFLNGQVPLLIKEKLLHIKEQLDHP